MFDPITVELIARAPPLASLDLDELPKRFTNAYAEIVAARVRMRGLVGTDSRTEALATLLDEMRRLAAAQEAFVASDPKRQTRAAAAFVAGAAHQLCLMAEIVRAQGTSSGDVDEDGEPDEEAASSESSAAPADELPRVTYVDAVRAAPEICATLLFLIADAQPDAAEMAKRIRPPEGRTRRRSSSGPSPTSPRGGWVPSILGTCYPMRSRLTHHRQAPPPTRCCVGSTPAFACSPPRSLPDPPNPSRRRGRATSSVRSRVWRLRASRASSTKAGQSR